MDQFKGQFSKVFIALACGVSFQRYWVLSHIMIKHTDMKYTTTIGCILLANHLRSLIYSLARLDAEYWKHSTFDPWVSTFSKQMVRPWHTQMLMDGDDDCEDDSAGAWVEARVNCWPCFYQVALTIDQPPIDQPPTIFAFWKTNFKILSKFFYLLHSRLVGSEDFVILVWKLQN